MFVFDHFCDCSGVRFIFIRMVPFQRFSLMGAMAAIPGESIVFLHYWKMLFLPLGKWLNIDHDFRISGELLSPVSFIAMVTHVIVIVLAFRALRKKIILASFGIIWFYITLLPYWIIPEGDLLLDYKAYLPAVGLIFILADAYRFALRRPIFAYLVSATLIISSIIFCMNTMARNQIYQSAYYFGRMLLTNHPIRPGYSIIGVTFITLGNSLLIR